jgi:hypothetical protein
MTRRLHDAVAELDAYRSRQAEAQPDLFSVIQAVAEAAGDVWRAEALEAVVQTAKRKAVFTVADLDGLLPPTIDGRAIGAVLLEAAKRGYIERGDWISGGSARHARPVRQWRSLIVERGEAESELQRPTTAGPVPYPSRHARGLKRTEES